MSGTQQQKQYINQSKIRCMLGVTEKKKTAAANTSETSWKAAKQQQKKSWNGNNRPSHLVHSNIGNSNGARKRELSIVCAGATEHWNVNSSCWRWRQHSNSRYACVVWTTFSNFPFFSLLFLPSFCVYHPFRVVVLYIFRPFIRSRIPFSASFSNEFIALWARRPANITQFIGDDRTTQFSGRTSGRKVGEENRNMCEWETHRLSCLWCVQQRVSEWRMIWNSPTEKNGLDRITTYYMNREKKKMKWSHLLHRLCRVSIYCWDRNPSAIVTRG